MNTSARRGLQSGNEGRVALEDFVPPETVKLNGISPGGAKIRVRVDSGNRAWHEGLVRMLANHASFDLLAGEVRETFRVESVLEDLPDVLVLTSSADLETDISIIRKVRVAAPGVRIVMFGGADTEREFLQYVRAGIRGYLLMEASAKDVGEALQAVQAGKAFCPNSLCGLLFNYFEREATSLPSGAVRQQLGLTRREQQLVPLIAQGLTNKEIANHFCLSEQTVKNHLYRMKHKIGADNRLGIVQTCHTQGFLL